MSHTNFLCCVIHFCFDVFIKIIRVINFKLMKAEMSSNGLCVRLAAFYRIRTEEEFESRLYVFMARIAFFIHMLNYSISLTHSVCVRAHSLTLF